MFDTTNVVSYLPDDPEHILLQLYAERDEAFAAYKVSIETNRFTKLFVNSYEVDSWLEVFERMEIFLQEHL